MIKGFNLFTILHLKQVEEKKEIVQGEKNLNIKDQQKLKSIHGNHNERIYSWYSGKSDSTLVNANENTTFHSFKTLFSNYAVRQKA